MQLEASLVVMGLANSGKSSIVRRLYPDSQQMQVGTGAACKRATHASVITAACLIRPDGPVPRIMSRVL
jgi:GTPase SAR1 family protein